MLLAAQLACVSNTRRNSWTAGEEGTGRQRGGSRSAAGRRPPSAGPSCMHAALIALPLWTYLGGLRLAAAPAHGSWALGRGPGGGSWRTPRHPALTQPQPSPVARRGRLLARLGFLQLLQSPLRHPAARRCRLLVATVLHWQQCGWGHLRHSVPMRSRPCPDQRSDHHLPHRAAMGTALHRLGAGRWTSCCRRRLWWR